MEEDDPPDPPNLPPGRTCQTKRQHSKDCTPLESLATLVSSKLEEGDFRGAVRLACSEDSCAEMSDSTLKALQQKHPAPHPDSSIPPPPQDPILPTSVTEEEVLQAIRSFPNGSAAGPDGLRPQHLKDMTGFSAETGGRTLLRALTSFSNLILDGKTPASIRPCFFGATLVALEKKEGGVRPIAVGFSLRRLAAKIAASRVKGHLGALLAPRQLGFGIPRGAEAAVHATRHYVDNLQPGHLVLKLDFRNAFNCARRDKMLDAVKDLAPGLLPFVYFAYCEPSSLFWGDKLLQSAEGVQQGDPLGPLLFCLTIHQLLLQLNSEFCIFYLDDGTLGGRTEDVLRDLLTVQQVGRELGLSLNVGKSEAIITDPTTLEPLLAVAPDLQVTEPEHASILGSPLGDLEFISEAIRDKTKSLQILGERLQYLHAHDAILLLRHSFAIPKLLYTLRTSPCFRSPELKVYDDLLKAITSKITNVQFHENDPAWTQASLPVKLGGLGIRSAVQLAPSAFLASAAGSSALVNQILPSRLKNILSTTNDDALISWAKGHDQPPPPEPASHHQRNWDTPRAKAMAEALLKDAPNEMVRARLLASSAAVSGAWLNALPVSSLGLRMDNEVIRVAVGLRLGTPLCRPFSCCHCGCEVSHLATHGLSCRWSEGRHPRHAAINDIIQRTLTAAGVPSRLEPSGLYRSDGKRPDGISIVPWQSGKVLVWDATCPDTFVPSHVTVAAREAGAVAEQAEQLKKAKYAHLDNSHHFIPVAVETSGALGPEALNFFRELGHRLRRMTGEPKSLQFLLQRLSIAVQRGNAAAVLGAVGRLPSIDDPFWID